MRFRPCIDIHNGKVKQIVGGSLKDEGDRASENFVSEKDAAFYADFYDAYGLTGGHVIMLNAAGSPYYEKTREAALSVLRACPGKWQAGGGIRPENAADFLDAGASHVIVTSYVFRNGKISYPNLERICREIGKDRLVLDLSCRRTESGDYRIVTDRWQKFTEISLSRDVLEELSGYCSEFLVHAADVEGKSGGIEVQVVKTMGQWEGIPVTYAGGIASFRDIADLKTIGNGRIDFTVGSALDLFGGPLPLDEILKYCAD